MEIRHQLRARETGITATHTHSGKRWHAHAVTIAVRRLVWGWFFPGSWSVRTSVEVELKMPIQTIGRFHTERIVAAKTHGRFLCETFSWDERLPCNKLADCDSHSSCEFQEPSIRAQRNVVVKLEKH
jgi:hypothetical protein